LEKYGANINFCNKHNENLLLYIYNKGLLNGRIFKFLYHKNINVNYFLKKLFLQYGGNSENDNESIIDNINSTGNIISNNLNGEDNVQMRLNKFKYKNNFYKYLNIAIEEFRTLSHECIIFIINLIHFSKNRIGISEKNLKKMYQNYLIKRREKYLSIPYAYLYELDNTKKYKIIDALSKYHVKIDHCVVRNGLTSCQNLKKYIDLFDSGTCVYDDNVDEIGNFLINKDYKELDYIFDQGLMDDIESYCCNYIDFIENTQNFDDTSIKYLVECGFDISNKLINCCFNEKGNIFYCILESILKKLDSTNNRQGCQDDVKLLIKYLLDHGVKIVLSDISSYECRIILRNVKETDIDFYEYLVEYGLNIKDDLNNDKSNCLDSKYFIDYCSPINLNDPLIPIEEFYQNEKFDMVYYFFKSKKCFYSDDIDSHLIPDDPFLFKCYAKGDIQLLKYLLKNGIDINAYDHNKETLLMKTCRNNDDKMIQYLVKNGADVNKGNLDDVPLSLACENENIKIIKYLLNYGATIRRISENDPLTVACKKENIKIIKYLLMYYKPKDLSNEQKKSLFFSVCQKGNIEVVKILVKYGFLLNTFDDKKKTPIMLAACNGFFDIADYLIQLNVNFDYHDPQYENELRELIKNRNLNGILNIYSMNFDDTDEMFYYLFNIGQYKYDKKYDGYTKLLYACHHRNINMIKYLLDHGSNINAISNCNDTVFSIINFYNKDELNYEIVQYAKENEIPMKEAKVVLLIELIHWLNNKDYRNIKSSIENGFNISQSGYPKNFEVMLLLKAYDKLSVLIRNNEEMLIMKNEKTIQKNISILNRCKIKLLDNLKYLIEYYIDINFELNDRLVNFIIITLHKNKDIYYFKEILNSKMNTKLKKRYINVILLTLLKAGNKNILKYLIYQGIDINNYLKMKTIFLQEINEEVMNYIKILFEIGLNINDINRIYTKNYSDGETLLMRACKENQKELVKLVLEHEANANEKSKFGNTPLMYACENNCEEIVKLLVELHCDINARNKLGLSALDKTCMSNNYSIFKYLIESGASIDRSHDKFKKTLLMMACEYGNFEMVKYLVENENDTNIHSTDAKNRTALFYACEKGKYKEMEYLIQHGSNINMKSKYGETVLLIACENGYDKIVKLLLDHQCEINQHGKYGETELIRACKNNNITIIKYLIEAKVDINAKDNCGNTGLIIASKNDHYDIINYLISKEADIYHYNDYGYNSFMYLCQNDRNLDLIKLFVEKGGINIDYRSKNRNSALMISCNNEQYNIFTYLIEKGANVDIYDMERQTPLMKSFIQGSNTFSKYLIEHGADLFCVDAYRDSALKHCIKNKKNKEVQDYIIKSNILCNKLSKENSRELDLALINDNYKMYKYLYENGVNKDNQTLYYEVLNQMNNKTLPRNSLNPNENNSNDSINEMEIDEKIEEYLSNNEIDIEDEMECDIESEKENEDKNDFIELQNALDSNNFDLFQYIIDHDSNLNKLDCLEVFHLVEIFLDSSQQENIYI